MTSGRHIGPSLQISREGRVPHIVYGAEIRGIRRSASKSVGKSGRCASEPVIERWQCFKRIRSTGTGSVVTTSTSGFFRSSCPRLRRTTQCNGLAGIVVCDGWPVGREPLIATVLPAKSRSQPVSVRAFRHLVSSTPVYVPAPSNLRCSVDFYCCLHASA